MNWAWCDEPAPPTPRGVAGVGAAARRLFAVLASRSSDEGLQATANADVLIVTAATAAALPWADGVQYIAPRDACPALWLPTTERPAIALDLLERAIRRRHPQQPLLLLREPAQLVPLTRLLPVDAGLLQQIHARWTPA